MKDAIKNELNFIKSTKDIMEDTPFIKGLNGYINIRIGAPVLLNEKIPLVLFPEGGQFQGGIDFTQNSLAHHISISMNHILARPDVYSLNPIATMDNIRLMRIDYDMICNIYVAQFRFD